VIFEILWKENFQPRNVIENVEKLLFLEFLGKKFLGKKFLVQPIFCKKSLKMIKLKLTIITIA
jgi:hypothetical protein